LGDQQPSIALQWRFNDYPFWE